MPTTLLGLVLFVVVLVPGLAFALIRERHSPDRPMSAFRETSLVACVSIACNLVALGVFGIVRASAPTATPDVGRLIRTPAVYLRSDYLSLFWWSVGILLLALLLSTLLGSGALAKWSPTRRPARLLTLDRAPDSAASGWWLLFEQHPEADVHVGCQLTDGSYLSGWLHSYDSLASDSPDRDLTIAAPIAYRPPGSTEISRLSRVGAVIVSARQIAFLSVSYVKNGQLSAISRIADDEPPDGA